MTSRDSDLGATLSVRREIRILRQGIVQTFTIDEHPRQTVLDALRDIADEQDPTLRFRENCGSGQCGSCVIELNGITDRSCTSQIADFVGAVEVAPVHTLPLVADLIVDFDETMVRFALGYVVPDGREAAMRIKSAVENGWNLDLLET